MDAVAIDAARLQYWLDRCADAGLTVVQVLPDAILLPVTEGGSTLCPPTVVTGCAIRRLAPVKPTLPCCRCC